MEDGGLEPVQVCGTATSCSLRTCHQDVYVCKQSCLLFDSLCDLSSGEVLGCLESCQGLNTIDLGDLCVTLDIFVLTLPLEIEVVNTDILHNR